VRRPFPVIARSPCDEAIQVFLAALNRFADPVIGRAFARPMTRNGRGGDTDLTFKSSRLGRRHEKTRPRKMHDDIAGPRVVPPDRDMLRG
jgi:hypothetical protein